MGRGEKCRLFHALKRVATDLRPCRDDCGGRENLPVGGGSFGGNPEPSLGPFQADRVGAVGLGLGWNLMNGL